MNAMYFLFHCFSFSSYFWAEGANSSAAYHEWRQNASKLCAWHLYFLVFMLYFSLTGLFWFFCFFCLKPWPPLLIIMFSSLSLPPYLMAFTGKCSLKKPKPNKTNCLWNETGQTHYCVICFFSPFHLLCSFPSSFCLSLLLITFVVSFSYLLFM